jgi:hypothetical protein
MRHVALSDYGYQSVIFSCYRTVKISNIVLANSRNYRTIGYLSEYQISDYLLFSGMALVKVTSQQYNFFRKKK